MALFRVLENEAKTDSRFLTGGYLKNLKLSNLRTILSGNVEIPLLMERMKCLNEAGEVLERKFRGSFYRIYEGSENDAVKLAELLIKNFQRFQDMSNYEGKEVYFYKRAQLNSKMISDILVSFGRNPLKRLSSLTAFADYKIPQILRSIKVLKYSKSLAEKVDNFQLITSQSKDEVEIRAATVRAVELIRERLSRKFPEVTPSHIDGMLWNLAQKLDRDKMPYHRTYTIAY